MPDKPTGRVVALIVLLIVVAAALRGYLPARDRVVHAESGSGRAALLFVVVALSAALRLLAVAVIARLRDPRAVAPKTADLSEMLGTGRGRPSWRVVLIGLGVIVAWLLIVMLLSRLSLPFGVAPVEHAPDTGASSHGAAPPQHAAPAQRQRRHAGNSAGRHRADAADHRCRARSSCRGDVSAPRPCTPSPMMTSNIGRRRRVRNPWCEQPNSGWPKWPT